ncbi:site-specific integrase [Streptomyces lunaelactis]|uniref:site-specific integrase n=2 Tax=Streptomyces lunaelactis TaxID=1535768 RepID=UPI00211D709F|nr:site-specific integrase [Streptomyces lunaelactis]
MSRVRKPDGTVPSISIYDKYEKTWNAAILILYQWTIDGEHRPISENVIRRSLNDTLKASGLVNKSGESLHFQPHDFRRVFITDAVLNGLPPHIAQVIAGHDSINTTMGYAAIYPADAIEAHRAFIARRRQTRPTEEYRAVTPEEWDEFLSHFERRKLALGDCGRAYGTDCIHEHACVRCPVLIVGPTESPDSNKSETTSTIESLKPNARDGSVMWSNSASASLSQKKRLRKSRGNSDATKRPHSWASPHSIRSRAEPVEPRGPGPAQFLVRRMLQLRTAKSPAGGQSPPAGLIPWRGSRRRPVSPFCGIGHSHEGDEQQVASYRAVCFRVRPRRGSRRSQWR